MAKQQTTKHKTESLKGQPGKLISEVEEPLTIAVGRNTALRQLHEGAAPNVERLAHAAGKSALWLQRLVNREKWEGVPEPKAMARRLAVLSRRIIALLDEPDDDVLLGKSRIDAITALLRAVDRLKLILDEMEPQHVPSTPSEASIIDAFSAIDQRIEQLAHAYAERLVKEQTEAGLGARSDP
jgi:hypothetical protein